MSLGNLQADILGILQRLGKATARDIMEEAGNEKHLAYTTVSTVLDRLHRKGWVRRTRVNGRGGAKYLYSYAAPVSARSNLVDRALTQLVNAFCPSIIPTIYHSLEQISKEDVGDVKKKVARSRK